MRKSGKRKQIITYINRAHIEIYYSTQMVSQSKSYLRDETVQFIQFLYFNTLRLPLYSFTSSTTYKIKQKKL